MPDPRVGYYVHHHGSGHFFRAYAIAERLSVPVTLMGSALPRQPLPAHVDRLDLPGDTAPGMHVERFDTLHYAPLGVPGLRQRMALMADWFRRAWPCLLVVDVSVEVAMLARLFGVPTIYLRQHGHRDDPAHRQAYAMASALLAPFPEAMESPMSADALRAKSSYCGWISRFANDATPRPAANDGSLLVINGRGGTAFSHEALAAAAAACPERRWRVVGEIGGHRPGQGPANLEYLGHQPSPLEALQHAALVIGSAGDNLVAEAASLGCRFIAIAEERPYAEQQQQARQLDRLGLAIGLDHWPAAHQWPAIVQRGLSLDPGGWARHQLADPAGMAAALIERTLAEQLKTPSAPR